jgi:hypothetical protein
MLLTQPAAQAQWHGETPSAPAITASMTLLAVVFTPDPDAIVPPSTGTAGIMPGEDYVIQPGQADPETGTSAKAEIKFNSATTVSVSAPQTMDFTVGGETFTMPVSFTCAVAETEDAQGLTLFPESCGEGFAWTAEEVSGMMTRWVMIGLSIPGTATGSVPAGTYTATLTLNLASGGS